MCNGWWPRPGASCSTPGRLSLSFLSPLQCRLQDARLLLCCSPRSSVGRNVPDIAPRVLNLARRHVLGRVCHGSAPLIAARVCGDLSLRAQLFVVAGAVDRRLTGFSGGRPYGCCSQVLSSKPVYQAETRESLGCYQCITAVNERSQSFGYIIVSYRISLIFRQRALRR